MTEMAYMIDKPLDAAAIAAVAEGAPLALGTAARGRIAAARDIVTAIVARGVPAYGVNTGVGALCDTAVDADHLRQLSRNLIMSHACGVGPALPDAEVRAIIAAQINNLSHGHSGVRLALVEALVALLDHDIVPEVPEGGSVGYLTHMAHIGLVLIGEGRARVAGRTLPGAEALAVAGLTPLVLEAKEGLSLINGAPCATGLGCLALARARRALDAADAIAAFTAEALGVQTLAFEADVLALHAAPGIAETGRRLRARLAGSVRLASGGRLQDALSLRAVPQVHGAVRDALDRAGAVLDAELASVTDNPVVSGTPEYPVVRSEAHAVAAGVAIALDALATATAHLGLIAERRLDRLVNPLVSGLPPFLARVPGVTSGFMIAQYTAAALVAECRRRCAPASLGGGITSALQEDYLSHPTAAALDALAVAGHVETILGIELIAAAAAQDAAVPPETRAPGTAAIHAQVRARVAPYADDRPMADLIAAGADLVRAGFPPA